MLSMIYDLKVYDTQCGAKFFKSDVGAKIFNEQFESNWLFDLELLLRARNLSSSSSQSVILEEPIRMWNHKNDSSISFKDYFKIIKEIVRIYVKYK